MVLFVSLVSTAGVRADTKKKRLIGQPRGPAPLVIDGVLDEPAWAKAQPGRDFIERTPEPGIPAAVKNEVRILFDEDAIYVGVTMALLPGETPRALELNRDNFSIFSDDAISLKFDVRHDQRTTVGFVINPAGTQLDYISLQSGGFRAEYDAIWEAVAKVGPKAWVAEFKIPVVALGLPAEKEGRVIGFNVSRDHNQRLATYDWSAIPPGFGATSAIYYGEIRGLGTVGGGTPMTLLPYVLGRYDTEADPRFGGKAGGDIRVRLAEDLWAELTILTDFAQVDLDAPQLNLNRFPLFFPERRPFFLSGLDVFDFGASGAAQVLFTRRIGLDGAGGEVPLIGGFKSYGSAGNFRYGVLEVLTSQTDQTPAANWSVGRMRYNFGNTGYLGVIGTLKGDIDAISRPVEEEPLRFDPAYSIGVDGAYRAIGQRLELSGFWARAVNTSANENEEGMAGQAQLRWQGEDLQPSATVLLVSKDFNPKIGFVRRRDFMQANTSLQWTNRTTKFGLARTEARVAGRVETRLSDGVVLGKGAEILTDVFWRNGISLGGTTEIVEDLVLEEFEVVPGKTVTPGRYRGVNFSYGMGFPGARNPSGFFAYGLNTSFFGGVLHTLVGGLSAAFGAHFRSNLNGNLSIIDFPERDLELQGTVSGSVSVSPSTALSFDLNVQLNTLSRAVGGLFKVRWRYLPGSDLFLVYREQLDYEDGLSGERSLTLKISYRYDVAL